MGLTFSITRRVCHPSSAFYPQNLVPSQRPTQRIANQPSSSIPFLISYRQAALKKSTRRYGLVSFHFLLDTTRHRASHFDCSRATQATWPLRHFPPRCLRRLQLNRRSILIRWTRKMLHLPQPHHRPPRIHRPPSGASLLPTSLFRQPPALR